MTRTRDEKDATSFSRCGDARNGYLGRRSCDRSSERSWFLDYSSWRPRLSATREGGWLAVGKSAVPRHELFLTTLGFCPLQRKKMPVDFRAQPEILLCTQLFPADTLENSGGRNLEVERVVAVSRSFFFSTKCLR